MWYKKFLGYLTCNQNIDVSEEEFLARFEMVKALMGMDDIQAHELVWVGSGDSLLAKTYGKKAIMAANKIMENQGMMILLTQGFDGYMQHLLITYKSDRYLLYRAFWEVCSLSAGLLVDGAYLNEKVRKSVQQCIAALKSDLELK